MSDRSVIEEEVREGRARCEQRCPSKEAEKSCAHSDGLENQERHEQSECRAGCHSTPLTFFCLPELLCLANLPWGGGDELGRAGGLLLLLAGIVSAGFVPSVVIVQNGASK